LNKEILTFHKILSRKNKNKTMNKVFILIVLLFSLCSIIICQPSEFSWDKRHTRTVNGQEVSYNYISSAKDQGEPGPCRIFASVAAVEAMVQIYFNKSGDYLDLSESYIYSEGTGCFGFGCGEEAAASTVVTLGLFKSSGVINEVCFPYPESGDFCRTDCQYICPYPAQRVFIPKFDTVKIVNENVAELKRKLMDYGPLIMEAQSPIAYALGHTNGNNISHTILIIGWRSTPTLQWKIKDSWQGEEYVDWKTINLFDFNPVFFRVYALAGSNPISCSGTDCSLFSPSTPVDNDLDGFYNWGYDSLSKPEGAPYPNLMDFDDGDNTKIFRLVDSIFNAPTISGPTTVCKDGDGDRTFELSYVPPGFTCSWYISKNAYCFNTNQGNDSIVYLYPNSSCIGKESEITFRITQTGDGGYAEYNSSFYVNCPREDLTSYSVLDSYGGSPPKYGDTYYLCPYTTYNIFYNEYDSNCDVTITDWDLPYGWSEHYHYGNYVSIYTNDWPDGFLEIKGTTECCEEDCNESEVTLMSIYFGAAECGGYFMAYPNPTGDFVDIDVDKAKLTAENIDIESECLLTIVDRSGMIKFKTEFKGFPYRIDTSNLPDGLYFVNIVYKGTTSTIKLVIKH
jgi:Papain family cysteine protease/Secretion system C-terminal sorting domain